MYNSLKQFNNIELTPQLLEYYYYNNFIKSMEIIFYKFNKLSSNDKFHHI